MRRLSEKKKKVILYGNGNEYEKHKSFMFDLFDVIAISDKKQILNNSDESNLYIKPQEIVELEYDYLVICSNAYRDSILVFLYEIGVDFDKILFLSEIVNAFMGKAKETYSPIINDMQMYSNGLLDNRFGVSEDHLLLINEKKDSAGAPAVHYFAQDIWVAKKIYEYNPVEHYDIASRLDGFIAHLLVFREVNYIDIRPLPYSIEGLKYVKGDATKLDVFPDNSLESISCLHAMEHFGLGRYGDQVDPDGYKKFASAICNKIKDGGHLYLGVPVGPKDRCVFNAHRIFAINTIIGLFNELKLVDIGIVQGNDMIVTKIDNSDYEKVKDFSCGLFEFVKTK